MRKYCSIIFIFICHCLTAQYIGINKANPEEALDVNGKIKVGNDNTVSSAGTIRFNPETGDFEGWDGNQWNNFSADPKELFWPAYQNRGAIGSYAPFSPNDANQGDEFGFSVDIEDNYAVVGCPGWQSNRGRAFVFKKEPVFGFWSAIDTLYGSTALTDERFGHSVSISGNKILIGAPKHLNLALNTRLGQAYVFKRNINTWDQIGIIPNSYCRVEDFGWDVKLSGQQAIISSPTVSLDNTCLTPVNTNKGEVWFINLDAGFFQTASLITNYTGITGMAKYGYSIDMDNGWAVVSAPFSQGPSIREDSIYIFKQDNNNPAYWTRIQAFAGYNYNSEVGTSVSIKGDVIYIGEPYFSIIGSDNKGALRIFKLNNNTNTWFEQTYRVGEDNNGNFGHAVTIDNNFGICAAKTDPVNYGVYIQTYDTFVRNHVTITDPLTTSFDLMVNDVSLSGSNFIIGLPYGVSENGNQGGRIFFGRIR